MLALELKTLQAVSETKVQGAQCVTYTTYSNSSKPSSGFR